MKMTEIIRRVFYRVAAGRDLDQRLRVQIRTAIGTNDPAPLAGLLAKDPQPDAAFGWDSGSPEEKTPLFLALDQKKFKAAAALLDARPDWLETPNKRGLTPLQRQAIYGDSKETFEFLIARGADMEAKDDAGYNVTMTAIRHSALDAAVILIGLDGKVDLASPAIETQLRVATSEMQVDFMQAIAGLQKQAAEKTASDARAAIESIGTQVQGGLQQDIAVKPLRLKQRDSGAPCL